MGWWRQGQALACAIVLLVTVIAIAIKMLPPVASPRPAASDRPNFSEAKLRYAPTPEPPSFEIQSKWDQGALWDDKAPAYDLSQADR